MQQSAGEKNNNALGKPNNVSWNVDNAKPKQHSVKKISVKRNSILQQLTLSILRSKSKNWIKVELQLLTKS